ncbi:MAG: glycosyltransferase, partial [Chitinophagaceae bacterium]
IFFLLMVGYSVLIEYYHRAWTRIPSSIQRNVSPKTKVSVIIALRNEEENIPALMKALRAQDYPRDLHEIILVNDHSIDDTQEMITAHAEAGYISAIRLPDAPQLATVSFKKMAIRRGIELSAGELIITTDADCVFEPGWISSIVSFYETTGAQFIAAPVKFQQSSGFLSVFQRLDFMSLQGITGASVFKKFHCMCNGANLAYTRAAFDEVNGFDGIDHIPSGDDMMLMYKIFARHPDKVHYFKSAGAIVSTRAAAGWNEFFQQRIRWASKAVHYDDKNVFRVLLMVYLVNVCFAIAAVASFWKINYLMFFLLMVIAKLLVEFPFVNNIAIFFCQIYLCTNFFHLFYFYDFVF